MFFMILSLAVVAADQLTKHYVAASFALGESVPVIQDVFHLTYVLNPGAAFGMLEGSRWLFVLIAAGVLGSIAFLREEIARLGPLCALGAALFAGGAFGNLIDRARQGLVIDFLDFRVWPVFNVADMAICVGVGLAVWSILRAETAQGKKER